MQTKPKGVTTQMKALDEYILMVLFVLLLERVHYNGTVRVITEESSFSCKQNLKV